MLMSCGDTATTEPTPAAAPEEKVDYVYSIDRPDTWVTGSKKNTESALKALKGWETGDIAGTMGYWADTVTIEFDNYEATLSRDSLQANFTGYRSAYKSVAITMQDWESVKSDVHNKEYVSLWYKQYNTHQNGTVDSLEVMDDLGFKNGKIISLNEKTRKLGPPKS